MAVGDSWTYAVTPTGMPSVQKTSTVQAFEDVGGMPRHQQDAHIREVRAKLRRQVHAAYPRHYHVAQ